MSKHSMSLKRSNKETKVSPAPKKLKDSSSDKSEDTFEEDVLAEKRKSLVKEDTQLKDSEDVDEAVSSDEEIQFQIEDLKHDDPFRLQFDYEISPELLTILSNNISSWTFNYKWPSLGNVCFSQPDSPKNKQDDSQGSSLIDKTVYASTRNIIQGDKEFNLEKLHIRGQLLNNFESSCQRFLKQGITDLQKELFQIASNYQDLYFSERTFNNGEEVRLMYCTHAVNHALKSRLTVIHNNAEISKGKDNDYRDHGLVRPKVLILVPFRDAALRVVKMIMSVLLNESSNIMNKKRFLDSYSGETLMLPKKFPKPPDYEQTFFGNTDDNFKIGLALTKKSLKLYVDFYSSDIIIASPLGLRMLIGTEGEASRDYDFLSSIELLILDQAEVFVMQNWDHVLHIMAHMHLVPKDSHGTDLTRVRMWALNGWSKYYKQNLIFCSYPLPEITALFNMVSKNFAGKALVINPVSDGSINQIIVPVPQLFHEIPASSVTDAIDTRFDHFTTKFLPQFKDPLMKHTLIYVPSYFDYVKIRNHFKKQDISFVQICEYTKENKIARARDLFYHGEVHFMLYSERFHFFRRIKLKGIRHILFYQPPAIPHFYSEMCNFIQDVKKRDNNMGQSDLSITVLCTKYDITQLAAIIGTHRATRMLASDKSVHMFMTEES